MSQKLKVSSTFKGSLNLSCRKYPLRAGFTLDLTDEELLKDDVKTSISRGWLVSNDKEEIVKEEPKTEVVKLEEKTNTMFAYDMERKIILPPQESEKVTLDQLNGEKMEVSTSENGEIDFTKKKIKLKAVKKKSISDKIKDVAKELKDIKPKKGLKPVGKKKELPKPSDPAPGLIIDTNAPDSIDIDMDEDVHPLENDNEISFVDIEQEQERKEKLSVKTKRKSQQ